jgi:acetyl-CoA carboxylase biotin carboxyl carrier protein
VSTILPPNAVISDRDNRAWSNAEHPRGTLRAGYNLRIQGRVESHWAAAAIVDGAGARRVAALFGCRARGDVLIQGPRHTLARKLPRGDRSMELTDEDVLEILKLFEQSKFDFLSLQQGERHITVSKAGFGGQAIGATKAGGAPGAAVTAPTAGTTTVAPASAPGPVASPKLSVPAADPGLVPVTAPMVGKFYAAPSPADPPYVQVGTKVAAGATVGLIEVMKVFASIKTEAAGTIEKILVSSGEFVESGQTLFLIRP